MSEAAVIGTCGSCRKSFRVPEAGRRYRCKACGGVVTVPDPEAEPERAVECPSCGAASPAGARFCDECGEPLAEGARRSRESRAARARTEVSVGLRRARKSIAFARFVFGFQAVGYGFALLFVYQGLLRSGVAIVPGPAWIFVGVLTLALAVAVTGFLRVTLEPFLWAVILAGVATLGVVQDLVDGGGVSLLGIAWAVVIWLMVPATVRVRRLVREHPDHYGVQSLQGTHAEARSRKRRAGKLTGRDAAELARLARRRLAVRTSIGLAGVLGGSGLLAVWVLATRPPGPEAVLAELVRAWNAGDREALERRFAGAPSSAARSWERLNAGPLAGSLPALGEPARRELEGRRIDARWETPHGEVRLALRRDEDGWTVAEFTPPLPPIEDLPERFRAAWNDGGPERVAALYAEDRRAWARESLGRLLERRGWRDGRPELGGPDPVREGAGFWKYAYDSEVGVLEATFRIGDDGGWTLASVNLPGR